MKRPFLEYILKVKNSKNFLQQFLQAVNVCENL